MIWSYDDHHQAPDHMRALGQGRGVYKPPQISRWRRRTWICTIMMMVMRDCQSEYKRMVFLSGNANDNIEAEKTNWLVKLTVTRKYTWFACEVENDNEKDMLEQNTWFTSEVESFSKAIVGVQSIDLRKGCGKVWYKIRSLPSLPSLSSLIWQFRQSKSRSIFFWDFVIS